MLQFPRLATSIADRIHRWPFLHLGLCLVPVLIGGILSAIISGWGGDIIANWIAKKRGKRIPENQLINLILPTVCGLLGSILFAVAGDKPSEYPYEVFLFGLGLMAFGFLGANAVGAVYVLEVYPHLAGPSLVNIASFRCIIAFCLTFKVSDWIEDDGYLVSFMIYVAIMGFFALLLPVVFFYGESWRRRWPAERSGDH